MAQRFLAAGQGKPAQMTQKAQRATPGRRIARAQAWRGKPAMALVEELPAKPGTHRPGDRIATEHMGKSAQHKIGIDPGLSLQIARIGLAVDFPFAFMEEERGLNAMGDFLDERNQRGDVALVKVSARIVRFQFRDDRARIKNGHIKRIARLPEKGAAARGEAFRAFARQAFRTAHRLSPMRQDSRLIATGA